MFIKTSPSNIHNVKCLRYIIKAMDSVFVNKDTRNLLPMALGLCESKKQSCGRVIKQIVDLCSQAEGNT